MYNTPSFPGKMPFQKKCVKAGIVVIVLKEGRIYLFVLSVTCHNINGQHKILSSKHFKAGIVVIV